MDQDSFDERPVEVVPQPLKHKQQVFVVPNADISEKTLRACLKCHLLKTQTQWRTDVRCENCGPLDRNGWKNELTAKFQGIVTVLDPSKSWLRRSLRLRSKITPGLYAVNFK